MSEFNFSNLKIWLIEDSEVYRTVLNKLLVTCTPYNIAKEFVDEAAITHLMQNLDVQDAELPDLILLDLYLPNIDGWDILNRLSDLKISKPVIIISTSSSQDDILRSKSYPNVVGYFVKSDFPANLFEMIRALDTTEIA
jgi:CheY-like chemotaxis protein